MGGFRRRLIQVKADGGSAALFLPGAGLNNATTAGMLAAMETAGLLGALDLIVGTSAGSFSAAYFIGGAAVEGAAGYWRVLPEFVRIGRFFSPSRLLLGRAMLDVTAVVEEIFSRSNPIPWNRVIASLHNQKGAFAIQALDAESGEIVLLRCFRTPRALKAAIIGSCWLPLLAGLQAYPIAPEVLGELEVADAGFRPIRKDRLLLFDGSVADYYMCDVQRNMRPRLSLYFDPLHRDDYGADGSLFGRGFERFEAIAAHILFRPYPKAIDTYIRHVLGRQRLEQAKALIDMSESCEPSGERACQVTLLNPSRPASVGRLNARARDYHGAVIAGWTAACGLLEMDEANKPLRWHGLPRQDHI